MPTGAPGTEVIPTQHEERTEDDVMVSQILTYFGLIVKMTDTHNS